MESTGRKLTFWSGRYVRNENGFVLILSMVMLSVLSILGVMVLNSTDTELKITSNARTISDAFVATELATEYAVQKVINDPTAIKDTTNYDLINDDADIAAILPPGITLIANGNEIDTFTSQAPSTMQMATGTDADLGNIYRTTDGVGAAGGAGNAAYYRVSVEADARGRSTTRVETLFVNRGGQVY